MSGVEPLAAPAAVLMVAYHFPPLAGSSGIQRTLRFVQQLPWHGWQPVVLTTHPRAYERVSDDLLAEIPPQTPVCRAFALDAARHLALAGRYMGASARPDRWVSWRFDGVRQGMRLIRRHRPHVLWSTFPIPTAHLIALELHRRSGLPWIADFRDPMAQDGYPADPRTWEAFSRLERETIAHAALSVFTTPGAARVYRERYPEHRDRIAVLENGYDEESFARVEALDPEPAPLRAGAVTLLHSGIVYPEERDPRPLFAALGRLKMQGRLDPTRFRLRFRSAVHDEMLLAQAAAEDIVDLLEVLPPVPYADALAEMRRADGLVVMQSAGCNEQIPAKSYEYLRSGRPLLCLSDPAGDTAGVLRDAGCDDIARLDDADEIAATLDRFVAAVRASKASLPRADAVRAASRAMRTATLAHWLDGLRAPDRSEKPLAARG